MTFSDRLLIGLTLIAAAAAGAREERASAPLPPEAEVRIPSTALNSPQCVRVPEARGEAPGDEALGVGRSGEFCAYPLRMMAYHRVVNDHLGGPPILVSFDPDSGAGRVFDPILDGKTHTFDASPPHHGLPVLVDRETRSLWSAISGEAISGPLAGKRLIPIPSLILTWERWKRLHADSWVLAEDPKQSPHYTTRTTAPSCPLPAAVARALPRKVDPRLKPDTLVLGIDAGEWQIACPLTTAVGQAPKAATASSPHGGSREWIVFSDPAARAAAAYVPAVDGQRLTFTAHSDGAAPIWTDRQTGSTWTLDGRCVEGPLKGQTLAAANSVRARWYAWSSLYPKTRIVPHLGI